MSSKKRIAILYSESISKAALGSTRTLLDLGNMLHDYYDIKFFSLGKGNQHIHTDKGIEEECFYSSASSDSRNTKSRMLDYISLIFLNKQRSYQLMNSNRAIHTAVLKYNPEFIITLGRNLVDLVILLQRELPSVHTISITDDFRVVKNSIKIRRESIVKKDKGIMRTIKLIFFDMISKRHLSFSLKIYEKMLKRLSATAFVTEIDRELSIRRYPNIAKKFLSFFSSSEIKPVYSTFPILLFSQPEPIITKFFSFNLGAISASINFIASRLGSCLQFPIKTIFSILSLIG